MPTLTSQDFETLHQLDQIFGSFERHANEPVKTVLVNERKILQDLLRLLEIAPGNDTAVRTIERLLERVRRLIEAFSDSREVRMVLRQSEFGLEMMLRRMKEEA